MSSVYHAQVYYGIIFPGGHEMGDEQEAMAGLGLEFVMYDEDKGMTVAISESFQDVKDEGTHHARINVAAQTEEWNDRLHKFVQRIDRESTPHEVGWFFSCLWS